MRGPWFGQPSPEQLSEIAIFDSHCARAYIDNKGDFAYAPYGLDILTSLVAACTSLKDKATKEKSQHIPNTVLFATLAQTQTMVGKALRAIPGTTKAGDIEQLANLTVDDISRLDALNKALAEAEPKQKAQVLRLRAKRFSDLSVRITTVVTALGNPIAQELRRLVAASKTAKRAAELAAKSFEETPGLLDGTGGEVWKALIEAARAFAAEAHAAHSYPDLPPEAACPLCQNPLGDEGAARLASFDAFIEQAAERAWRTAQSAAKAAL